MLDNTARLPVLSIINRLIRVRAIKAARKLRPKTLRIPRTRNFAARSSLTHKETRRMLARAHKTLNYASINARTRITRRRNRNLDLKELNINKTMRLKKVNNIIRPRVTKNSRTRRKRHARTVKGMNFTEPSRNTANPTGKDNRGIPSAAASTSRTSPSITASSIFRIIRASSPTFTPGKETDRVARSRDKIRNKINSSTGVTAAEDPNIMRATRSADLRRRRRNAAARRG